MTLSQLQVIDYSAGFPGARAIKGARYGGAVRYIGFPDRRKCTTAQEFADFRANGISMALVYENNLTEWRGGYSAGQSAGQRARNHANAIGFPQDRPIYVAIDQDVVTTDEFDAAVGYIKGAASSIGGMILTGVYGEADVMDRIRSVHAGYYFWQTAAWSRGRRTNANLFQHVGSVSVGGVACDVNDVLAEDWGQHNYGGSDGMITGADVYIAVAQLLKDTANGSANDLRSILVGISQEGSYNAFASVTKDIGSGAAPDLAVVWGKLINAAADPDLTITDEQLDDVASQLSMHLSDDLVNALGQRLIQKSTKEG